MYVYMLVLICSCYSVLNCCVLNADVLEPENGAEVTQKRCIITNHVEITKIGLKWHERMKCAFAVKTKHNNNETSNAFMLKFSLFLCCSLFAFFFFLRITLDSFHLLLMILPHAMHAHFTTNNTLAFPLIHKIFEDTIFIHVYVIKSDNACKKSFTNRKQHNTVITFQIHTATISAVTSICYHILLSNIFST